MRTAKTMLALAVLVLPATMCSPVLTSFDVPATVWAGHEFVVGVWGKDSSFYPSNGANVGCVLQLPLGVTAIGFDAVPVPQGGVVQDDPALLAGFTVEPGCHLTSFHGFAQSLAAGIQVRLQAPTTLPAGSQLKVAIALEQPSGWATAQSDFAQIGGNQAKPIQLVTEPPAMVEVRGLPALDTVTTGDLDHDGRDELFGLAVGGASILTCRWNGSAWASTQVALPTPAPRWDCVAADLDGDGHLDLVLEDVMLFGDGIGGFVPGPSLSTATGTAHVAIGDIDGDGRLDVVVTHGGAEVFHNDGNRTFSARNNGLPTGGVTSTVAPPVLADVTGDGNAELAVLTAQGLAVYTGGQQGAWSAMAVPQANRLTFDQFAMARLGVGGPPSLVVPDNDTTNGTMGIRVSTCASGVWTSAYHALAAGYATGVTVADVDGDGVEDVLLSQSGVDLLAFAPQLRLFRTLPGPAFVEVPYSGLTAYGTGLLLAAGDFDGDGWPDLAGAAVAPYATSAWLGTMLGAHGFGQGCGVGSVAPTITPLGAPQLGNLGFGVGLANLTPNQWGIAWFGLSNELAAGSTPLPLALAGYGAPGCALFVDPLAPQVLFVGASGAAAWPLPLPPAPALHRMHLFAQGATMAPGANVLGGLFSGGLALRLD